VADLRINCSQTSIVRSLNIYRAVQSRRAAKEVAFTGGRWAGRGRDEHDSATTCDRPAARASSYMTDRERERERERER